MVDLKLHLRDRGEYDMHCVEFNADMGVIKDNNQESDVVVIDDTDRSSTKNASQVFKYLFPGAREIEVTDVYQLSLL